MPQSKYKPYQEMILNQIREKHIRMNPAHDGRLFLISEAYPGYWLEHLFDSVVWARLYPEDTDLAVSQLRLFLEHQSVDGQIPAYLLDNEILNGIPGLAKAYTGMDHCPEGFTVGYGQLQECVSLGSICLDVWRLDPTQNLHWYYDCCCKWDNWLCRNRMTMGKGLVETFCGFDTGHDNSARFHGIKYQTSACTIPSSFPAGYPVDCPTAPLISPDVNAVFYGNRMAMAEMAKLLDLPQEAADWKTAAEAVRERLFEICYDPADEFFYDVDRHGKKIPVRSVSITSLFCEHVLDQNMADRIYNRWLGNPKEFAASYGFPGVSVSDLTWRPHTTVNCWGYYAQGNVAIRTLRWMKDYGREAEMKKQMAAWLDAWCKPDILRFGQELHPVTGCPSRCSAWYSSTMLYLLASIQSLFYT